MSKCDTKQNALCKRLGPEYRIRTIDLERCSVSLIERLVKQGLLTASDYKKAIDVLNKKYGISSDSIFAEIA